MEYSKISSLPHFRESFPSPSFKGPNDYACNTFVAPLSASTLQAYNNMNASMMNKRKAHDYDILVQNENDFHDPKRMMVERPNRMQFTGTRQRQESGCSVSSSSSWSSSASFSTVCSSATIPDLSTSSPNRSLASSRSPSPSESISTGDEYNPLWHICDAIALSEKQDAPQKNTRSTTGSSSSACTPKAKQDESMYGLKIVFLEPNWLEEHIAKSKKVAALKKQQLYP
ncbi:hypothetical protein BGZ80_010661 [Entomortierella chlamydospora]|uniref:Uncharacterized protein n=1 Tax=Entomortierella chlamydospora TaxID=101097 RepID=A0A9P6MVC9_9FUNG|nr:hypothetical protein BGZ79_002842 [Entomortierella chlamydospora]KAG0014080.1 hypothetical protein BGZ80_010661 [Entomortierella chlamydospora]